MQPIAGLGIDGRREYGRTSVRERIVAEIYRRLKTNDWTLKTEPWRHIQRTPIDAEYDGGRGSILALVDGAEEFGVGGQRTQNTVQIDIEFALIPGEKEEDATVLNLICAELVELFGGEHTLAEGGDGASLSCTFYARSFEPEYRDGVSQTARGLVTFEMQYRTRVGKPFELA